MSRRALAQALAQALASLLLGLLGMAVPAEAACVKTLAWSEDPPHTMRLPDGSVGGIEIELHRELLALLGCELRLQELPFARALAALRAGEVDVIPATLARPEREAYARFSRPLLQLRNVLFVRRPDTGPTQHLRLAGLVAAGWRLGGQTGVAYGSEFVALLEDRRHRGQIIQVPYRQSLWQMLARHRLDGVLANELTGVHELRALGLQDLIVPSELALAVERGGSAWSRHSTEAEFVERFNGALQTLKASGRYATLLAPYGLDARGALQRSVGSAH
ncbi:MAG: transporter substrate-binding domain-containing protein [Inhella sp.]